MCTHSHVGIKPAVYKIDIHRKNGLGLRHRVHDPVYVHITQVHIHTLSTCLHTFSLLHNDFNFIQCLFLNTKCHKRMHTLRHESCQVDELTELKHGSTVYLKREKQAAETGKNGKQSSRQTSQQTGSYSVKTFSAEI